MRWNVTIRTVASMALVAVLPACGKSDKPASRPSGSSPAETRTDGRETPKELTIDLGGGVTMALVMIPAGDFMMGSPRNEQGRGDDEWLPHRVKISKPFHMGKYEVTQAQWKAVMGTNPSLFKGEADRPVEEVSWDDCQEFCQKQSDRCGRKVRLPTEAEWEYACRAGSKSRYSFGDSDKDLASYAWYGETGGGATHPVGRKIPNAFGLYDMHGNVFEWCQDWYEAAPSLGDELEPQPARAEETDPTGPSGGKVRVLRVLRGGSWNYIPWYCRAANRYRDFSDIRDNYNGLRVVVVSGGSAGTR